MHLRLIFSESFVDIDRLGGFDIERSLDFLETVPRDIPARQRSFPVALSQAFHLSGQLLSPRLRVVWIVLGLATIAGVVVLLSR